MIPTSRWWHGRASPHPRFTFRLLSLEKLCKLPARLSLCPALNSIAMNRCRLSKLQDAHFRNSRCVLPTVIVTESCPKLIDWIKPAHICCTEAWTQAVRKLTLSRFWMNRIGDRKALLCIPWIEKLLENQHSGCVDILDANASCQELVSCVARWHLTSKYLQL